MELMILLDTTIRDGSMLLHAGHTLYRVVVGLALAILGARDRSSRKLYPLLGLGLNVTNLTTYVTLAFIGG